MSEPILPDVCPPPAENRFTEPTEPDESVDPGVFVLAQPAHIPGERVDATRVLEVYQVCGDAVRCVHHFPPGTTVRVGSGQRADVPLLAPSELLPFDDVSVFEPVPNAGWALRYSLMWSGQVERGDRVLRLDTAALEGVAHVEPDGLYRLPLGPEDRVVLEIGRTLIVARPVHPAQRVPAPTVRQSDPAALGMAAFVVSAMVVLALAVGFVPPAPAATRNELEGHVATMMLRLPVPTPAPPDRSRPEGGAPGREGSPRRGRPDAGHNTHRPDVRDSGIISMLQSDAMQRALGGNELSSSIRQGIDGLIGVRDTANGLGLGQRGDGLNGGSIGGVGPIGTGHHGGDSVGWGGLCGGRPDCKKTEGGLSVDGPPVTIGVIDPSLVDRVVKRNLASIRYCYQRQLQQQPALAGKVSVKFVISRDGSVSSASAETSSLHSPAVEACIQTRFMNMTFPAPKGGGIVIVKYPFLFAPG